MTRRATVQDALRRIQDLLLKALGRPVPLETARALESILESVAAGEVPAVGDQYSHRDVTILIADLRGFAAIADSYPAPVVLGALNGCFSAMTAIVARHCGSIDKFMGDAIMVVFPADSDEPSAHARSAVLCAVEMQLAMDEIRRQHHSAGLPEMFLGIGINSGPVMAGLIGSDFYRAHTVIGGEVNLASRIEAYCLRGQILLSESTYGLCRGLVETAPPVRVYLKGQKDGINIHEVKAIPSLRKYLPEQDARRSPRVDVVLPFAYQVLDGKTVLPEPMTGTILDISYGGVLAEIGQALEPYSEIRLELDLLSVGYLARDVYGRVLNVRDANGRYLAGIEFTSLGRQSKDKIELFVQMLVQTQSPVVARA